MKRSFKFGKQDRPVLSGKQNQAGGKIIGILFGTIFFLIGSGICYVAGVRPILKSIDSQSWPEAPCVISESYVQRNSDSDGDTFTAKIRFSYDYDHKEYVGGRYEHIETGSSGRKGKEAIVRRFPIGYETTCWVNPKDPTEAVLSRGIPKIVYFVIPFTSIFILIGASVAIYSIRGSQKKEPVPVLPQKGSTKQSSDSSRGETILKPATGTMTKIIVIFLFGAFWNGFIWIAILDSKGSGTFFYLFMIPFVLVGLALIAAFVYQILSLRNPKFEFILSEGSPQLGERIRLRWSGRGSLHRLENLSIRLRGLEKATYRRGTDTRTDECVFHAETLFETNEPALNAHNYVDFTIPAKTMHSFKADNNEILWQITIAGEIKRWPDVGENYSFSVRPIDKSAFVNS